MRRFLSTADAAIPFVYSGLNKNNAIQEARRGLVYIYTSYKSRLWLPAIHIPKRHVPPSQKLHFRWSIPMKDKKEQEGMSRSDSGDEEMSMRNNEEPLPQKDQEADVVAEERYNNALLLNVQEQVGEGNKNEVLSYVPHRAYVPLEEVVAMELKGDYLMDGGMYEDALRHYGIVVKAFQMAYPENHNQMAKIFMKLARAFRVTDRLEASEQNLEHVLWILENNHGNPILDYAIEALLELGLTKAAKAEKLNETNGVNDDAIAQCYEDTLLLLNDYHELGDSHRNLRKLHRMTKRFGKHGQSKFQYWSPFSRDRVFALVDQALEYAIQHYEKRGDTENQLRVLEDRIALIDRKFWNMRDTAGRIRMMRGRAQQMRRKISPGPSIDDLFNYSPTLHQPYRDFSLENDSPKTFAPLHQEVFPGTNRKVMDDGDPYRDVIPSMRERYRIRGRTTANGDAQRFLSGE